ncbi:MAG TPA: EAL domain-containing protein [Armatimonadota bacterium]|jgi:diguanylate cyclase (GGDEF)-like protein/PAS domain S-box-containing protein
MSEGDISVVLDRTIRSATALVESRAGEIALIQDGVLVSKSTLGIPVDTPSLAGFRDGFCQRAVKTKSHCVWSGIRERRSLELPAPGLPPGAYSAIAIPILDGAGSPIGTLSVMDGKPRAWTAEEISLLTDAAAGLSARLELGRFAAEADLLRSIVETQSVLADASSNASEINTRVLQQTIQMLAADGGAIGCVDGDEIVFTDAAGIGDGFMGLRVGIRTSLTGRSLMNREVLHSPDIEADPRVDREPCRRVGFRSLIAVPLIRSGQTVGLLDVMAVQPNAFSERDVQSLRLVAGYLATILGDANDRHAKDDLVTALKSSEQRYLRMVNIIHDGMWVVDIEGVTQFVNQRTADLLGRTPSEVVGKPFRDFAPQSDRQSLLDIARADRPRVQEVRFVRSDGAIAVARASTVPVSNAGDELSGTLIVLTDITDQRKAEADLETSRNLEKAVFDNTQDATLLIATDGRIVDANQAAVEMLGYRLDELKEQRITEMSPAAIQEEASRRWAAFLEAGRTRGEIPIVCKDGTVLEADYQAVANVVPGLHVASFRDATLRKQSIAATERSEASLRAILNTAGLGIVQTDTDSRLHYTNRAFQDMLGYSAAELGGANMAELSHPDDRIASEYALRGLMQNEVSISSLDHRLIKKDGGIVWVSATVSRDNSGPAPQLVGVLKDISQRKESEKRLERYQLLAGSTTDIILFLTLDGSILEANGAAARAFGYSREELRTLSLRDIRQDPEGIEALLAQAAKQAATYETLGKTRSGDPIPLEVTLQAQELGGQGILLAVAHDIRERKGLEDEITRQAFHDPLTGLPNRTLFTDRVTHAIARCARLEEQVAILLLDLDRFQVVNDSLGPAAGDELLVGVGGRLSSILRAGDTAARLGGDEFGILLDGVGDVGDATRLAERVLRQLQAPFTVAGQEAFVGASIGIVVGDARQGDAGGLIRDADLALCQAKAGGRGRYEVHQPRMSVEAQERLRFETELRHAIANNEFEVHYQPIVLMEPRRVIGAEALVRWRHPRFGLMPPDQFIPIQEQIGAIETFTLWVLEESQMQCLKWHRQGYPLTVSVNLSPINLQNPTFVDRVHAILTETMLPAYALKLEVTEGAVMVNPARALDNLRRLSDLGVRLSIDDFGTGYSSLSYLRQLPVHEVKIDRSFVTRMDGHDEEDAAIVRAVIDLAHNLRKKVVAEGVETESVWNLLKMLGCDAAQGFLMGRPMPAREFAEWLETSEWSNMAGRVPNNLSPAYRAVHDPA